MSRLFRASVAPSRPVSRALGVKRGEEHFPDPSDILEKAKARARSLIENAKEQAVAVLDEAKLAASEQRENGFRQGYDEGFEAGLREAQSLVEQAQNTLELAEKQFTDFLRASEPKLLALALEIASRILHEELSCDPSKNIDIVRKGMDALRDEKEFSLIVNPALLELMEESKEQLKKESGASSVEIVGSTQIEDGVVIQTPGGFLDATLKTQIENVAKALFAAKRQGKP